MNVSGKRTDAALTTAVLVVSLTASLVFVHAYPLPTPKFDAVSYYRIARNVAAGKGFSIDGVHPYASVPPLFSTLLAMWFRLAGDSVYGATVLQSLLHALGAAASFLLFRAMPCGRPLSLVLSLVVSLQPILLTRVAFVLQEPTILLFTTTALLATVAWLRGQTDRGACLAGVFWGLASLAKAVNLVALPLAFAWRLACGREGPAVALRQAVLFTLLFLAVLAPWTARNYVLFHRWIPISDQLAGTVKEWYASRAATEGAVDEVADSAIRESGEKSWDRWVEGFLRKSKTYLGNFPVDRMARNAIDFAGPARDWWWERGRYGPGDAREWYWAVHDVFHRLLFLNLLYLVVQTVRGRLSAPRGFVALFCFLYWIGYSLILGIPRYGIPLYPALLALLIPGSGKHPSPPSGTDGAGRVGKEPP